MENEFKSCPYCGEKIRKEAKKCRFCGEWLTDDTRKAAEMKEKAEEKAKLQKWLENRKAKRSGAGVMTVFLLILFLVCFWGGVAYIVHLAVPSKDRMELAIVSDIEECVTEQAANYTNFFLGEEIGSLASLMLDNSEVKDNIMKEFNKYNTVSIESKWFWTIGKIYNRNTTADGTTICFGMLGFVVPFVEWDDIVLMEDN